MVIAGWHNGLMYICHRCLYSAHLLWMGSLCLLWRNSRTGLLCLLRLFGRESSILSAAVRRSKVLDTAVGPSPSCAAVQQVRRLHVIQGSC